MRDERLREIKKKEKRMVQLEAPEAETSCLLVPQYGLSSKNASSYISHNATNTYFKNLRSFGKTISFKLYSSYL